jgi:hypothetical protein
MCGSLLNSSTLINYSSAFLGSEINSRISVEDLNHRTETDVVRLAG